VAEPVRDTGRLLRVRRATVLTSAVVLQRSNRAMVKSRRLTLASLVILRRSATATIDASIRSSRMLAYCSTSS
jgi:hypothetical protein